ncbi:phage tail family protein [Clostridium perfringens]|uniref:distal tail protein Dit n=1 Tax=Clostridium perfringens TaxID=1502 RepID=UPI001A21D894|nr:distal tail protein Dit [Clostridium perfringens]EIF6295402.1 phage tail family protein [Clostridium perfringens]MDU2094213.1 phage tail family protein [Clostridium perfringens]MDU2227310.1 phage tail family protein [Clostridium perfringens]UBK33512.1 phage tail family protein [Clostridium perfringens]UBL02285.1 phage tail family protein [Clostridium perfringens]
MFYFIFNNKKNTDLGIKVVKRPNIPIPERNIELKSLKGRDGSLTRDYKTYNDIKISVSLNFISGKNDFINKGAEIADWLYNITDNKLIFLDNDKFYYKVKKIECKDIERSLKVIGKFTVTFVCDPYKYYIDNNEIEITNSTEIISPPLVVESKPIVTVIGNGDIYLNINNKKIQLEKIDGNIIIDSILKECYKENNNLNYKMHGEFPKLIRGNNNINFSGSIEKIIIKPNWRCL